MEEKRQGLALQANLNTEKIVTAGLQSGEVNDFNPVDISHHAFGFLKSTST